MSQPQDINAEAHQLLEQESFVWSDDHHGYRRTIRPHEDIADYEKYGPVVISYDDLADHDLIDPPLNKVKQKDGLEWLRKKIESLK
jgi:hypothetical protein